MAARYDVVVAGAGFAGLACAEAARREGMRVAVIDRKAAPGTRVHTTGILVKEAAQLWPVPQALTRKVERVRLYGPNLRGFDLASPGYHFLATDTPALLRWHAGQAARAGIDFFWQTPFEHATRSADAIALEPAGLTARYLVGADGPRSAVAAQFGLGRNEEFLIGAEVELAGVRGVADALHVFLSRELAPGYIAWVVPGLKGMTQVGLACRPPAKPDLSAFVARIRGLFDFTGARVVGRRAGPIPVGGRVAPFAAERVLLTGDAAGLVSPLTAGGIHTAVLHGSQAGRAVGRYLGGAGPDPRLRLEPLYPRFFWKRRLRYLVDRGAPDWAVNLGLALPPVRRLAKLVFFHTRGLKSAAAWRDVFGVELERRVSAENGGCR
jgi:digeranylgeranylglycerophospholipid reductase